MSADLAIVTEGLLKNYGAVRALRGLDLEVRRGEIYGFLGPNGAGKTTTIRCLLDLIRPHGGRALVLGMDPQRQSVQVRARCGYLPGELRLEERFTAEGLLRYLSALRGRKVDWVYVRQLAQRLDFDLSAPVRSLSKGNKQKLGLLQALGHRPELLLLDEPTSGLDPLMQHQVLDILRQVREQGATVFFSSHIISEVENLADRAGIIRKGKLVEVVAPSELFSRSLRRLRVRCKRQVSFDALARLPGVQLLTVYDDRQALLQVEGDMEPFIQALARYPVSDVETERPSLEEVFMAYYRNEEGK
jgi:ABC-2 type transport system ATP-binding protein